MRGDLKMTEVSEEIPDVCPVCNTTLYTQLFNPKGSRFFCPNCGYEKIMPFTFTMTRG
jgi:predicted RNA-binding Zn-ribbon protein involved in translation (DUF1610 family)